MSVTSSRTPASEENSWSTPSILIEVTAAPWSEERRTRRSELPRVIPKPRSSGSATKTARRRLSPPDCFFSRALGFLSSCQFFALTAIFIPWQLGTEVPDFKSVSVAAVKAEAPVKDSDAAALAGPYPVVRDRGHVADRGDREADRLEGTKRALAARTGPLDLDLERSDAVIGGLAARILCSDLCGIGGRLAAALEPHHPGARPGNRIALRVGDGDHGIVEAGVHVSDAGGDVLALPPAEALRFACHWSYDPLIPFALGDVAGREFKLRQKLLLLPGDRLGLALAGARIGMRALAANGEPTAVAKPAIAGEVHQPLDVHRGLAAKVAFDREVLVDRLADVQHLLVGEVLDALFRRDSQLL